jgi:hypothetical protein
MNGTSSLRAAIAEEGPRSSLDLSRERRQWVRFILPDIITRASWMSQGRKVSHVVHLVNVSGASAVLQMDDEPPADGRFTLHFDRGHTAGEPIDARIVTREATSTGKTLLRVDFESLDQTHACLFHQRERRAWRRARPMHRRVVLSWQEDGGTLSIHGDLQDISGGGAAVLLPVAPPAEVPIWLSTCLNDGDPVGAECRLAGSEMEPTGLYRARLGFIELCPFPVYAVVMGLSTERGRVSERS